MKILNIPSNKATVKCCSCNELKCIRREFDSCEHCEVKAGFWLKELERVVTPPLFVGGVLQSSIPDCFVSVSQ